MTIAINELIQNPDKLDDDSCYGFVDWFCKDEQLQKRYHVMLKKLEILVDLGFVDGDRTLVSFKNCCPTSGDLYDIMFFYNENIDSIGMLCPSSGHTSEKGQCYLWNGENGPRFEFKNWREFKKIVRRDKLSMDEEVLKRIYPEKYI